LLEESSGQEETSGVGSSVRSQTGGQTPLSELERVSSAEDLVTLDGGVDDLSDDSSVGGTSDQSVLGGIVFILILDDKSLSGIIVSFSLSSSFEFGLISHEISFVLNDFNEGHFVVL
jgi:hypothetical protein